MAVVVNIAHGHDASRPFKAIGAGEGPVITGEAVPDITCRRWRRAASPPEPGSATVPLTSASGTGDVVRREDFDPLYGQFLDPLDPSGRTYLGSPPRVNAELAA